MAEKNQNIQDVFLNRIRKDKHTVTVFLVNGVKLQGIVTWFDNFSLLLRRDSAGAAWFINTQSPPSCRPARFLCMRKSHRMRLPRRLNNAFVQLPYYPSRF